jgi:hypothetical protein
VMLCRDRATENRATFMRCNHIVVYLPILAIPVAHVWLPYDLYAGLDGRPPGND